MISTGDMLVGENDILTSVRFPSGDESVGTSVELEVEAAVPRGLAHRSILEEME